jgi:hypothetical protein
MKPGHFVGATLAAALLCMGTARAQEFNFLLRGTFSVTAGQTCLLTIGGFNPDLTPTDFSFITTTTSVGTAVFNGDGTASETLQEVSVTEPPLASGSSDTASFKFTYQVNADRTVTAAVDGAVTGQTLTGVSAGQTFTLTNTAPSTGHLSLDLGSVNSAVTDPVIETISFSGGVTLQRICTRTGMAIKVSERTGNVIGQP